MHIPGPVRRLYESRGGLTVLTLVVVTAVLEPFDLGWRRLEIVSFAALVALVIEFWLESGRVHDRIEALQTEHDELEGELSESQEVAARVEELEAENYGLESERDQLREQLHSPRMTLEDILSSIDSQIMLLDLVRKHRAMEQEGLAQWAVTSFRLQQDNAVAIVAHVEDSAERLAAEWVAVIETLGESVLTNGQIASAAGHQVGLTISMDQLPHALQSDLLEHGSIHPGGIALRLLGLTFAPYLGLANSRLEELRESLRDAGRVINEVLAPTPQLEFTEGEDGT